MAENKTDERVLIIAPFGQDAAAMASLLTEGGVAAEVCDAATDACRRMTTGVGALLLTEEALELPQISALLEQIKIQPPWSEVPVIILTRGGESHRVKLIDIIATAAGSMTLLERPIRTATLCRSVEVALRSRRRQYQMRDLLHEEERERRDLLQTQVTLEKAQSELRQHAATLEKTMAETTHANEQLEAFVYSIAHDLRGPLRSMTGFSHLLVEDHAAQLDDHGKQLLHRIRRSAEFMDTLLLDLLAYGCTARAEIDLKSVPLQKAWEIAVMQCSPQIEQSRARVETVEPLAAVIGHEATLGQCLANLLSNALKFVAPGVQPHIRFWTEVRGDWVRLWVEDNGIGIPDDQRERAFRLFERPHGTRYPGTGVGLPIVRKGIERMRGKVGVNSKPGEGSQFWIELPNANP
jgi:signal transduction histidine kinase